MFELDKRTIDEMRESFLFFSKDSFWQKNILSTSKWREKFDELKIKSLPIVKTLHKTIEDSFSNAKTPLDVKLVDELIKNDKIIDFEANLKKLKDLKNNLNIKVN